MPGKKIITDTGKKLLKNNSHVKSTLQNLLNKAFTSKYDNELKELKDNFKSSTCKLYSMINNMDLVIDKCRTAIDNLVLIILTNDNKKINIQKVKYNIGFYLNLAKKLMDCNDHHSSIIIKCAIDNSNIKRLKIKYNKKMTQNYQQLEEKYGSFKDMHSSHLNDILKYGFIINWFPSILIINNYTDNEVLYKNVFDNFNKIDSKSYVRNQLINIKENKYFEYENTNEKLCNIYEKKTIDINLPNFKNHNIKSTKQLLNNLSFKVDKK